MRKEIYYCKLESYPVMEMFLSFGSIKRLVYHSKLVQDFRLTKGLPIAIRGGTTMGNSHHSKIGCRTRILLGHL